MGQVGEEPEDVEDPENYNDNDDRVENGFNRSLHGNEAVDEPEYDSHDDQHDHNIDERHRRPPLISVFENRLEGGGALYGEAGRVS